MALFGGKQKPDASNKPAAKKAAAKKSPAKKGAKKVDDKHSADNVVDNIKEINQLAVVAEDPDDVFTAETRNLAQAPPLATTKNAAYSSFKTEVHSEKAAEVRKNQAQNPEAKTPKLDYEVGRVYAEKSGREFYYDEYGKKHYTDESEEMPTIPDSFEHSYSGVVEDGSYANLEPTEEFVETSPIQNSSTQGDAGRRTPKGRKARKAAAESAKNIPTSPPEPEIVASSVEPPSEFGYSDESSPNRGQTGSQHAPARIMHADGVETIDIRNAEHIEDPYSYGANVINEQIESGASSEEFPTIMTTIASLVNSSKTPEEITKTLIGYINLTLANEGTDATMKLLGSDNIYSPLLVTALLHNQSQTPIDPVARQELWDLKPNIRYEEKVVYVKDPNAKYGEGRGFWVDIDENAEPEEPLIYNILNSHRSEITHQAKKLDYRSLDY